MECVSPCGRYHKNCIFGKIILEFFLVYKVKNPGKWWITHKLECAKLSPYLYHMSVQFSSFHLLSHVRLFATPWTTACRASLSFTNSRSLLKLMSITSVMPSNHLILCRPLLLLPSIFPSLRVFSNESVLCIRWPKVFQLQHQSFQWIFRTDFL